MRDVAFPDFILYTIRLQELKQSNIKIKTDFQTNDKKLRDSLHSQLIYDKEAPKKIKIK